MVVHVHKHADKGDSTKQISITQQGYARLESLFEEDLETAMNAPLILIPAALMLGLVYMDTGWAG